MASQVFKLKYYISNVVTLHGTFDYYNSITILTINGTKWGHLEVNYNINAWVDQTRVV